MTKMTPLLLLSGCLLLAGPVQAGSAEAGKAKAEPCADCHGDNGKGDQDTPAIAGMSPEQLTKAINEYKSGVRTKSKKMTKVASKLSDEDIADLAAYFATLPK